VWGRHRGSKTPRPPPPRASTISKASPGSRGRRNARTWTRGILPPQCVSAGLHATSGIRMILAGKSSVCRVFCLPYRSYCSGRSNCNCVCLSLAPCRWHTADVMGIGGKVPADASATDIEGWSSAQVTQSDAPRFDTMPIAYRPNHHKHMRGCSWWLST